MITIRKETMKEHAKVYDLTRRAFEHAEHQDGTEHELVVRLRKSPSFVPELSLVALDGETPVGHILFTKVRLGEMRALGLAPLSILPEYQRRGIGSRLIQEGHRIAQELGFQISVVVGSEHYYPRFGYRPAHIFGISAPFEVPDVNFMALGLMGECPQCNCMLEYDPVFFEV